MTNQQYRGGGKIKRLEKLPAIIMPVTGFVLLTGLIEVSWANHDPVTVIPDGFKKVHLSKDADKRPVLLASCKVRPAGARGEVTVNSPKLITESVKSETKNVIGVGQDAKTFKVCDLVDAQNSPPLVLAAAQLQQESGDGDLFGPRGGYFHPYITLGTAYTDNLYNVDSETTTSWVSRIAPGVWFSMPRSRTVPVKITPHNSAPGGLQHQVKDLESTERYQAYALGGLNYRMYSEDSDLDDTDGRVEGLFRYNMRGGLSLQVMDSFTYGQDEFGIDSATRENLRRYSSNMFMGTVDYDITEKIRAKVDYSNFTLEYDDELNSWLDRTDNLADVYGYYRYSPKTTLFLQYRYADVAYDTSVLKDNEQHYGYGGIQWDTTEKLSLHFKMGYQLREYTDSEVGQEYDWDGFTFDLRSLYRFTEKTQLSLDAYSRSEESDSGQAADQQVFGAIINYQQRFTDKLSGVVDFMYESSDYSQAIETDREDDWLYFRPALQYTIRDWLMTELAYSYSSRDSTDDEYDFDANTIIFNINFAL